MVGGRYYHWAVSVRQALHAYIDALDEDDLRTVWDWLQSGGTIEFAPLTDDQRASIERGREQSRRGGTIPHAEVLQRFKAKYSVGD